MTQYTITEENDWEGETFGYIVDLTPEEFSFIEQNISGSQCLSIEESNYTKSEVTFVNKHSENTYMARLGFYCFKENFFDLIEKVCQEIQEDFEWKNETEKILYALETEIFYKAKGLTRCTKNKKNEKKSQRN